MSYQVDLFGFLDQLSMGKNIYSTLSPEEQKELQPVVVYRWLSCTSNGEQLVNLSKINHLVFNIRDKDLLFSIMAASCSGRKQRYKWIKAPGQVSAPTAVNVVLTALQCSPKEALMYIPHFSPDDIIESAERQGLEAKEITKLKQELKDGFGKSATASKKSARK